MIRNFAALVFVSLIALPPAFAGALQTVVLDVQKMTCPVCPITVRKSLEKVQGVSHTQVDFDRKTATVTFDPDKASPARLIEATTNAGYPSSVHK